MKVKQYEIWLADLNPQLGTEAGKTRPVLVVQTNLLNEISHTSTLICPLTTQVKPAAEVLRIHLKNGDAGVAKDSDIMIDQLRAIDNNRLIKKLGQVSPIHKQRIKENLRIVLDL